MKINYLENENKQLRQVTEDLHESLKINKGIIKNLLDAKKSSNATIEYTFSQLQHENEFQEQRLQRMINDIEAKNAQILIMQ